jgi:two-component system, NtrC family, sensor kinase
LNLQFYGLRTGILTQLLFLIIAAMLLVNVAMLNLSQRHLLQSKADAGKFLIQALALNIGHLMDGREAPLTSLFKDNAVVKETSDLLLSGGYTRLVITDTQGNSSFSTGSGTEENRILLNLARISMQETETSFNYRGNIWGVFWLSRKEITVSGQLTYHGRTIGAATISSPLESIYQSLRKSERLVLLYIIFDTIILALVGIYLLSRIVVKPIHRLLKMTDKYMEGDILPSLPEDTGNEIGSLSRSLNIMLQRLDENKQELKRHISSLVKANLDLKLAQNEVIRSEKLASVGRLAAGLAHEIGNPLGIILGYLELIRKADITDEEKRDFLNRIESEISRINIIIRQLLDFSRPSSGNNEEESIHEIIADTINMMRPHPLMDGINIHMNLNAKKDIVFTNSGQLQQVFINILMNAADVLNESSHADKDPLNNLLIATENIEDTIEIRFIDNGPGIEEDKIQQIFDPFYTTKEPGMGTGLGLSVSYMIIGAQGGKIRAESAKGKGMAIIINLPVHEIRTQGDRQ